MPNRVVAVLPAGTGAQAARDAATEAWDAWKKWVRQVFGESGHETPAFPVIQWICVAARAGAGYEQQWEEAQRLLAARRRVRDFGGIPEGGWRERDICSLSPRWPAEPKAPAGTPKHDEEAKLSTAGWVKRSWRRSVRREQAGFPSTASIASAPYRQAVLRLLRDGDAEVAGAVAALERAARAAGLMRGPQERAVSGLAELIPDTGTGSWLGRSGGPWVYPERWERQSLARESEVTDPGRLRELSDAGAKAARDLQKLMKERVPLTSYLAVVVQDVDSMGLFLGGKAPAANREKIQVTEAEHGRVSRVLGGLAATQPAALRAPELLGVPVYSGGDDLLLFTPARTALTAAEAANAAIPPDLPTVSTAVLYFHYHASIQQAMTMARHLLDEGKDKVPGKHALAVGYLRRSGTSEASIQPWLGPEGKSSAALFGVFARDAEHKLSPRLAADLERDAGELDDLLRHSERIYQGELARLVRRHTADRDARSAAAAGSALAWLGRNEAALNGVRSAHVAAKVGVFLRQEAR